MKPQLSQSLFEYLVELDEAARAAGASLSIWEILAFTVMNKSLHSVWILVETLQFFAFLSMWQIVYEPVTKVVLEELKRIVLGEYMDDLDIGKRLQEAFNIEPSEEVIGEKSGKDRLGSESLFANIGSTLFIVTLVFALIVTILLVVLRCSKSASIQCREKVISLKKKVFFNSLIRFCYLNSLKFNILAWTTFIGLSKGPSDIIFAVVLLLVFNIMPILYSRFLKRKNDQLSDDEF